VSNNAEGREIISWIVRVFVWNNTGEVLELCTEPEVELVVKSADDKDSKGTLEVNFLFDVRLASGDHFFLSFASPPTFHLDLFVPNANALNHLRTLLRGEYYIKH